MSVVKSPLEQILSVEEIVALRHSRDRCAEMVLRFINHKLSDKQAEDFHAMKLTVIAIDKLFEKLLTPLSTPIVDYGTLPEAEES